MPADSAEISEGEAEGIIINPSLTTTRIVGNDVKVTGIECVKVTKMKFDETGRLELVTDPDDKSTFQADNVIFAIGQVSDLTVFQGLEGRNLTPRKSVDVEPVTLSTGIEVIYAGGDISTNSGSVIEAIAYCRR